MGHDLKTAPPHIRRLISEEIPCKPQRAKRHSGTTGRRKRAFTAKPVVRPDGSVLLELPIRLVNQSNAREHWSKRKDRANEQRGIIAAVLGRVTFPSLPMSVLITRIGKKRMDDDGATTSAKFVRDGIADALRCDDGDPRLSFRVVQEIGADYGVRIEIGKSVMWYVPPTPPPATTKGEAQ